MIDRGVAKLAGQVTELEKRVAALEAKTKGMAQKGVTVDRALLLLDIDDPPAEKAGARTCARCDATWDGCCCEGGPCSVWADASPCAPAEDDVCESPHECAVSHDEARRAVNELRSFHGASTGPMPKEFALLDRYRIEREAAERAAGRARVDLIEESEQLRTEVARLTALRGGTQRYCTALETEVARLRAAGSAGQVMETCRACGFPNVPVNGNGHSMPLDCIRFLAKQVEAMRTPATEQPALKPGCGKQVAGTFCGDVAKWGTVRCDECSPPGHWSKIFGAMPDLPDPDEAPAQAATEVTHERAKLAAQELLATDTGRLRVPPYDVLTAYIDQQTRRDAKAQDRITRLKEERDEWERIANAEIKRARAAQAVPRVGGDQLWAVRWATEFLQSPDGAVPTKQFDALVAKLQEVVAEARASALSAEAEG